MYNLFLQNYITIIVKKIYIKLKTNFFLQRIIVNKFIIFIENEKSFPNEKLIHNLHGSTSID